MVRSERPAAPRASSWLRSRTSGMPASGSVCMPKGRPPRYSWLADFLGGSVRCDHTSKARSPWPSTCHLARGILLIGMQPIMFLCYWLRRCSGHIFFWWCFFSQVSTVSPNTEAFKSGLRVGDIVIAIGQTRTSGLKYGSLLPRTIRAHTESSVRISRSDGPTANLPHTVALERGVGVMRHIVLDLARIV